LDTLILARHAFAGSNRDRTCSYAAPGEGLTPEGIEQAKRLRDLLAGDVIDLGIATELRRTQQTLELALDGRPIPTLVVPELNEIHFGSFDGGLLERYRTWAAAELPGTPAPGGGESRATAAARYARGLRRLLARPERVAFFVGHALVVRYVLDAAEGLVPAARMTPVEHAVPSRLDAGGVEAAAGLLEGWSRAPSFRDPSVEGRAGP
jgi:broad specificity phosphatase PhoE